MKSIATAEIISSLKQDETKLEAIKQLPPETQAKYAPGIAKLRHRIFQERAALGLLPEDTESWAKWVLEDVGDQSEDDRRHINSSLAKVDAARVAADLLAMHDEQQRLEQFIREITAPEQIRFVI